MPQPCARGSSGCRRCRRSPGRPPPPHRGRTTVPRSPGHRHRKNPRARAGERRDRPARAHLAHPVVREVGDVDVPLPVHRHPIRGAQLRRRRRATVAERRAATGERPDRPPWGHLAHAGAPVEDVDVPLRIRRYPPRVGHRRRGRRSAVPGNARSACAGDRRDRPGGVHFAHALVVAIGDVDVPLPVHRHPVRGIQTRRGRRTAVPGKARYTRAGERCDRPGRVSLCAHGRC